MPERHRARRLLREWLEAIRSILGPELPMDFRLLDNPEIPVAEPPQPEVACDHLRETLLSRFPTHVGRQYGGSVRRRHPRLPPGRGHGAPPAHRRSSCCRRREKTCRCRSRSAGRCFAPSSAPRSRPGAGCGRQPRSLGRCGSQSPGSCRWNSRYTSSYQARCAVVRTLGLKKQFPSSCSNGSPSRSGDMRENEQ